MYEHVLSQDVPDNVDWPATLRHLYPSVNFDENVWHLPSVVPGKRDTKVRWKVDLGPYGSLTDVRHCEWLLAAKCFLILVALGGSGFGSEIRPASVHVIFGTLRSFIKWMAKQGLLTFAGLSEQHVADYRDYVCSRGKLDYHEQETNEGLAPSSRRKHLNVVRYLVKSQPIIPHASKLDQSRIEEILSSAPIGGADTPTPRIPDDIFVAVLTGSLDFIKAAGDPLMLLDGHFAALSAQCQNRSQLVSARRRLLAELRRTPLHVEFCEMRIDLHSISRKEQYTLLHRLITACYVVIAGFVGMRCSEILSMRKGSLSVCEVPEGKLLTLEATLYKTADCAAGEACTWVAGWDSDENPVKLAVTTLERLIQRDRCCKGVLFDSISEYRHKKRWIPGLARGVLEQRINAFAVWIGIHGWHFAPHQFRKVFARFVTLKAPNAEIALQRQFQHTSAAMTARYLESDPDLISEILDQRLEADLEVIDEVLAATNLAGRKGKEILSMNAEYRGAEGARKRAELRASLRSDPAFIMLRHVYGDCFYESDGGCDGKSENVGPDACGPCKYALFREVHRPYWISRLEALRDEKSEIEQIGLKCSKIDAQIRSAERILLSLI